MLISRFRQVSPPSRQVGIPWKGQWCAPHLFQDADDIFRRGPESAKPARGARPRPAVDISFDDIDSCTDYDNRRSGDDKYVNINIRTKNIIR